MFRMLAKLSVAAAATATLYLGSLVGYAPPASAVTVTATVPNNFVSVYKCSRYNGRCSYQYTYQTNPPYNSGAPSRYSNRYDSCWCWV